MTSGRKAHGLAGGAGHGLLSVCYRTEESLRFVFCETPLAPPPPLLMTTQLQVRKHKLLCPLALCSPRSACTSSQSRNSPPPTSIPHAHTMTERAKPSPNRLLHLPIRNGLASSGPRRLARPTSLLCYSVTTRPRAFPTGARSLHAISPLALRTASQQANATSRYGRIQGLARAWGSRG